MDRYPAAAFLRQCFESHRGELTVGKGGGPRLLLHCRACRLGHLVTLRAPSKAPAAPTVSLAHCLANHSAFLAVGAVDLGGGKIGINCQTCKADHRFEIAGCETRPRQSGAGR